jgi:peroxiredoxin
MNAYIKGAIVSALVILAIVLWYRANMAELPVNKSPDEYKLISKMESEGVPDFTLEKMDGSPFKLSEQKGKIIIVNFWASWCNPCVEEFPSMIKLIDKYKEGVTVVAVSTDDDRKDIHAFLKAFGLPRPGFEVVWDKNKSVMKAYGIEKVPESFLVGKDFKLIRKVLGIENWFSEGAVSYFQGLIDGRYTGPGSNPHAQAQPSAGAAGASDGSTAGSASGSGGGVPEAGAPTGAEAGGSGSGSGTGSGSSSSSGQVHEEKIPTH